MPDITLTIDGQAVTVPAGTNLVEAARQVGVSVPVFCYHPKMKPVGMCRMCLVEAWTPRVDPATRQVQIGPDGKPVMALMMNKLQPGCVTPVSEGMEVRTKTDKVAFAQRGQLEFLLTSHPLDCPVCDKGGECPLQNLTMEWGPGNSRFDYTDKVHFEKPIPLGNLIYLDRERCILCARCVRFQDEIADDPVLGFDNRGRSWEIISKSDPPFDSKFSGNTTDICPVGALTSADFRFKARVWELRSVPNVCNNCSVGCNRSLDMRLGDLMRVMPRENDFVNEIWLCDKGRYGMRYIDSPDRLTTPLIRRDNQLVPASWDEAYQLIADRLTSIRDKNGGQAIGGLVGPGLPNEDLFLFQKLMREVLGSGNIDYRPGLADDAPLDDVTPQVGVGIGTNLMTLGASTAVLVIGADVEEEAPLYKLRLRGIATRGGDLTVASSFGTSLDRSATRVLRVRPGAEAYLALALVAVLLDEKLHSEAFATSRLRDLDQLRRGLSQLPLAQLIEASGVAEETLRAAARAFAKAENGIIVYGRQGLAGGAALTTALTNLLILTGKVGRPNNGVIALVPGGNSRGALDMGVRPDATGLSARAMWSAAGTGQLKAMYIADINPAGASPQLEEALNSLEFLVVQDLFLTETARLADVVLPVAAAAEREGTFTNVERRVQRSRQARQAPNNLPADWLVFQDIARAIQARTPVPVAAPAPASSRKTRAASTPQPAAVAAPMATWNYLVSSDIADEIGRTVPGYAKTNYISLELTRKSWGREPNEPIYYDGTSYTNTEGVGVQLPTKADDKASALPIGFVAPAALVRDEQRPYALLMPDRLYDGGDWSRGSLLQARVPAAHAILSAADAQKLGVAIGEPLRISSAIGAVTLLAQIDARLPEGVVLAPAVRGVDPGAITTGAVTQVAIQKAE